MDIYKFDVQSVELTRYRVWKLTGIILEHKRHGLISQRTDTVYVYETEQGYCCSACYSDQCQYVQEVIKRYGGNHPTPLAKR